MPKVRYRRRNMCDGKLVAYILEDDRYNAAASKLNASAPKRTKKNWWSLSGSNR